MEEQYEQSMKHDSICSSQIKPMSNSTTYKNGKEIGEKLQWIILAETFNEDMLFSREMFEDCLDQKEEL